MNLKTVCLATAGLLVAADLAACAAGSLTPIEVSATTSGAGDGSGGTGGTSLFPTTDSAGGGSPIGPCNAAGKLVYTLVYEGGVQVLYSFDPATLAFAKIGPMICPRPAGTAAAADGMTIDRNGIAWVLFDDLTLFQVDTANAHCVATGFDPAGLGVNGGGIAFLSDSPGSSEEKLYMALNPASEIRGLVEVDQQTLKTTPVVAFDPDLDPMLGGAPQLTGSGDGRLFSVWPGTALLAEVDPSTAHVLWSAALPGAINKGFAPFFWGGALWVFGNASGVSGSTIHRHDLATGVTTTLGPANGTGYLVTAAGVSTCAPLKPPS